MDAVISLDKVSKIYRTNEIETIALENVNLQINRGEFIAVMGPSGCGKSTLLNIMGLLDRPSSGNVMLMGKRMDGGGTKIGSRVPKQALGLYFPEFSSYSHTQRLRQRRSPLLYRKKSDVENASIG